MITNQGVVYDARDPGALDYQPYGLPAHGPLCLACDVSNAGQLIGIFPLPWAWRSVVHKEQQFSIWPYATRRPTSAFVDDGR